MSSIAREFLSKRFCSPEYVLLDEVPNSTGGGNRRTDFVAMNMWSSRGLAMHGFEVKSHRGDWLSEKKNPAKAELMYRFYNYFWLVTTKEDVAFMTEIPETWGWLHIKGKRMLTMKEAPKRHAEPFTKDFVAAMLRRASNRSGFVHPDDVKPLVDEAVLKECERREAEISRLKNELAQLRSTVASFQLQSGIQIDQWNSKNIGRIVRSIESINNGHMHHSGALKTLKDTLEHVLPVLEECIATFALPEEIKPSAGDPILNPAPGQSANLFDNL